MSRDIVSDLGSDLKSVVGGTLGGVESAIATAIGTATGALNAHAVKLSADAVVGVTITVAPLAARSQVVRMAGTAVTLLPATPATEPVREAL